jgi:hypothetical protein
LTSPRGSQGERKHHEEVPDLGQCRISDERLEAFLPQGDNASDHDRACTHRCQELCSSKAGQAWQDVEPKPQENEERSLHDQAGQDRARSRGCTSVSGREPEVQGKERRLGEEPCRHQCRRNERAGVRGDAPRQQCDVERAVEAIEQGRAHQVKDRTEQREKKIAQRRLKRLCAALEADQRHRSECQQFQSNIEGEEIAADEDGVERCPDRQQQNPECKGGARVGCCRSEIGCGINGDRANHDCRGCEHYRR